MALTGALLIVCGVTAAQQYGFRRYGYAEGLQSLAVTGLLQDQAGYLWLGTQNWLLRYDGTKFKTFGLENGVPGPCNVDGMVEATDGALWVSTCGTLARGVNGQFKTLAGNQKLEFPGGVMLARAPEGGVYVATPKGMYRAGMSKSGALWLKKGEGPYQNSSVAGVAVDTKGKLWFGCGRALCVVDGTATRLYGESEGLPKGPWGAMLTDPSGNVWVRSAGRLFERENGSKRFVARDQGLPPTSVSPNLALDMNGKVLVATDDGLARQKNGRWELIDKSKGLQESSTATALVDREGSLWIGLFGGGLERLAGHGEWESYLQENGLADDSVWTIRQAADGTLWIGSDTGLTHLDPATRKSKVWKKLGQAGSKRIESIVLDRDGTIWVSGRNNALFHLDPKTDHMQEIAVDRDALTYLHLMLDNERRVWIGSKEKLLRSNRLGTGALKFERIDPMGLGAGAFDSLLQDGRGDIWATSDAGLFRLHAGKWSRFTTKDGLADNQTYNLAAA